MIRTVMLFCFSVALLISFEVTKAKGSVDSFTLKSQVLEESLVGIDTNRQIKVWLPSGYSSSNKSYPVIYYLHSFGWSNTQMFEVEQADKVLARSVERGVIDEFIFVVGDFTTDGFGSFYGNNKVSGRWEDHIVNELVPAIDARYRTIAEPRSRGLSGDMIGGYAALRIAMLQPGTFSSVYALHPVGTDIGETLMNSRPDWRLMNTAKTWSELDENIFSKVFMLMAQAYAPNPDKPPFYADLMLELKGDELVVNPSTTQRLHKNFLLSELVPSSVENLRRLKGLAFDWGRYDGNQDHVYANQKFTRKLDEYGIEHLAEEYRGNTWNKKWIEYGRVESDMLPFFQRFLEFE